MAEAGFQEGVRGADHFQFWTQAGVRLARRHAPFAAGADVALLGVLPRVLGNTTDRRLARVGVDAPLEE
jgi:hypothetical protein